MKERIVKTKTKDGFECEINLAVLESYRFLRCLQRTRNDGTYFCDAIQMLIGEDAEDRLLDHLDEVGRGDSVEVLGEVLAELMNSHDELKNF